MTSHHGDFSFLPKFNNNLRPHRIASHRISSKLNQLNPYLPHSTHLLSTHFTPLTIIPTMSTTTTSKRKSPTTTTTTSSSDSSPKTIHFTSRTPTWTYLKLQLYVPYPYPTLLLVYSLTRTLTNLTNRVTNPPSTSTSPLDPLTARTYLSAALSQFLGLMGTTIPLDILKVSPPPSSSSSTEGGKTGGSGSTVWARVPRDDAAAVVAALSSWIGGSTGTNTNGGGDAAGGSSVAWRVCAKGNYLGALVNGGGREVFVP